MKLNMTAITCGLLRTAPALALIAAFATFPGTAVGAAPVQQFHNRSTGSFSTDACGIAVDVNFVSVDNFFLYADGGFKDTYKHDSQTRASHLHAKAPLPVFTASAHKPW